MRDQTQLPRIPTPFHQRFREFRIKAFPIVGFVLVMVIVWKLWHELDLGGLPGMAEGSLSVLTSPRMGLVAEVNVEPFQWVAAGTTLMTIYPDDPQAELDLLHLRLDVARLQIEPSLADQNAINYERLRIAASLQQTDLALAKVNLDRAEPALKRNEQLLKDHLVSQDVYEASLRDRDFYRAEIDERTKALKDIEERLRALGPIGQSLSIGTNVAAARVVSEMATNFSSAASNLGPVKVVAPISGMVRAVFHHSGEYVAAGGPLVRLESERCERIVAYLRQPSRLKPEVGMHVTVATRTQPRERFETEIFQVGAQLEVITNALVVPRMGMVELGLPIVMNVPSMAHMRPGEIVDVFVGSASLQVSGGDPVRSNARRVASQAP